MCREVAEIGALFYFFFFLPLLPFYAVPLIRELPAACCSSICEPGRSDFQV